MKQLTMMIALIGSLAITGDTLAGEQQGALATAMQLLDAFNRHDPAAMAALVDHDFQLYYVSSEGVSELATSGPDQLENQMVEYFRTRPTVRSEVEGSIDGPRFAAFRERAISRHGEVERSQSSMAVYEVVDGKILRVWYYPAEAPRSTPVGE